MDACKALQVDDNPRRFDLNRMTGVFKTWRR